jgi:hypothetical protein
MLVETLTDATALCSLGKFTPCRCLHCFATFNSSLWLTTRYFLCSENVEIYVFDTGAEQNNQFEDRLACGYDDGGGDCGDSNGHGTHVAAIAGVSSTAHSTLVVQTKAKTIALTQ